MRKPIDTLGNYNIEQMFTRVDVDPKDISILVADDHEGDVTPSVDDTTVDDGTDESDEKKDETRDVSILDTGMNETGYAHANHADFASPIARDMNRKKEREALERKAQERSDSHHQDDSVLELHPETNHEEEDGTPYASSILSYYNEAALKAKTRNALPDDVFGIPRLRAYPLHDKAHVQQAIRMFNHCKDPKDRKTLANNIFAAMKKFNVTTKIGKKNGLYEYAPEELRESASDRQWAVMDLLPGLGKPLEKRTKADVVKEHMKTNGSYYNNVFYGNVYAKAAIQDKKLEFLKYFWPDVKRMNFTTRLFSVCGGLGVNEDAYRLLGMRFPLSVEFNEPVGWSTSAEADYNGLQSFIATEYSYVSNWFGANLSADVDHCLFCLRLYAIMSPMFADPNFDATIQLQPEHTGILTDWGQRVLYHYDLYKEAEEGSKEQIKQIQYLWDLYWCFADNPLSEDDVTVNVIAILDRMASVQKQVIRMNEGAAPDDLVAKEQCNGYLVNDLGLDDHFYLLPDTLEYPIIDRSSVRLAMDMIESIPDEQKKEYAANLNQKYKELGCTFSIGVDHPYAKYADAYVVDRMTHMLLEGDTAVADDGTSAPPSKSNDVTNPWYKRLDYVQGIDHSVLDNSELGPNTKKMQEPDYTPYESFL